MGPNTTQQLIGLILGWPTMAIGAWGFVELRRAGENFNRKTFALRLMITAAFLTVLCAFLIVPGFPTWLLIFEAVCYPIAVYEMGRIAKIRERSMARIATLPDGKRQEVERRVQDKVAKSTFFSQLVMSSVMFGLVGTGFFAIFGLMFFNAPGVGALVGGLLTFAITMRYFYRRFWPIAELSSLATAEDNCTREMNSVGHDVAEGPTTELERAVAERLREIHREYANRSTSSLEALKRALFLQWYALSEPAWLTGLFYIDGISEAAVFAELDKRLAEKRGDRELWETLLWYVRIAPYYKNLNRLGPIATREVANKKADLRWLTSGSQRSRYKKRGMMGAYFFSLRRPKRGSV